MAQFPLDRRFVKPSHYHTTLIVRPIALLQASIPWRHCLPMFAGRLLSAGRVFIAIHFILCLAMLRGCVHQNTHPRLYQFISLWAENRNTSATALLIDVDETFSSEEFRI